MIPDLVTLFGLTRLTSPADRFQEDKLKDLSLFDLDQIISVYTTTVTPECDGNVTCYQPVLANNGRAEELCKSIIAKPVFLSASAKRKTLSEFVIDHTNLVKLDYDKTIFSGKIILLETIGDLSLESILNYVMESGSLYAITDEQLLIKDILNLWLPTSFGKFKFGSVLRCTTNSELLVASKPQLIISFHDLRNAIPIFDKRCVEGIAVDIRLFFEHEKSIFDVVRCWYLLSNYEENVLYIDGEELSEQSSITSRKASELLCVTENAFGKYYKLQKKEKLAEAVKGVKTISPSGRYYNISSPSVIGSITINSSSTGAITINNSTATYS